MIRGATWTPQRADHTVPLVRWWVDLGAKCGGVRKGVFRRDGDLWTVILEGRTIHLRDTRGLRYVAVLLHRPGTEVATEALRRAALDDNGQVERWPQRDERSHQRAHLTVIKAITTTLKHIRTIDPDLAAYLKATIRRGHLCQYVPDPRDPIEWHGSP